MNRITELKPDEVFVFGSNLLGHHAGGAARDAVELFGAENGASEGLTGQCCAIPTLDAQFQKRPLQHVQASVALFFHAARLYAEKTFIITPIGCGIAGFKTEQIAQFFKNAPANCRLPEEFAAHLNR